MSTLAMAIRDGDRRALARAITLIESSRTDHRRQAEDLLAEVLPDASYSLRIGVSGAPGVGKSTFIEAFGLYLIEAGHRVAVLAVDPSSRRTGGSILGDKTRMEDLSRSPGAYIRPSPSSGTLGGVARRTREVIALVESTGFDIILVETVGGGQSETAVADLVDMFLLLLAPGAGNDLQGIKKGIVELADLIVVNKADGDLAPAAERAYRDYAAALHLMRPSVGGWTPRVGKCSAFEAKGIAEVWQSTVAFRQFAEQSGAFANRRAEQAMAAMWGEVTETLLADLTCDPEVKRAIDALKTDVRDGRVIPAIAARQILSTRIIREKM